MTSSLPDKLFDGQTGFPTPNAAPDINGCRVFSIPDDEEWFALLMGAVLRLTQEWAWYQNGTMTPAEAAAAWTAIIDDAYARSLFDTCGITVPIPWWDETSADDADDESDVETQPWYGEIVASMGFVAEDVSLSFLDNLGIWLIAGFIAYSGQIGAAIAFVPLAKTFVLSFKQNSLGGVVRVLIDLLHVADIDTYGVEDAVLNLSVVMPDDGDPHTLYVELSEDNPHDLDQPSISVIRKRLSEDQVTPPNTRWDETCNCVQTSPDNGTTWNRDDGQDPRVNPAGKLPALSGGDPQCDAAERIGAAFNRYVDTVLAAASIVEAINGVLSFLLIFLPAIGIILAAIGAGIEVLFGIGTTLISVDMTDAVYEQIKCIIYCHLSTDGQMSQDQLDAINADISTNVGGVPNDVWTVYQNALGFVGLSNSGVKGIETGDCTDCDCGWCFEWDFSAVSGIADGWFVADGTSGVWTPGTGWVGVDNGRGGKEIFLKFLHDFTDVTEASFVYTMTDYASGSQNFRLEYPVNTPIADDNVISTGIDIRRAITGTFPNVAQWRVDMDSGGTGGISNIYSARIKGTGTPPTLIDAVPC